MPDQQEARVRLTGPASPSHAETKRKKGEKKSVKMNYDYFY